MNGLANYTMREYNVSTMYTRVYRFQPKFKDCTPKNMSLLHYFDSQSFHTSSSFYKFHFKYNIDFQSL